MHVYGDMIYTLVLTLQRGYSWEFLFGVCHLVLQILINYFRPKNGIFHTRFQTRSLESVPIFRPGLILPVQREDSQIVGELHQFPPVLFSRSCFLNLADPTISEPGTGLYLI